uniref:Signal-induced proliferation-associated 1-like protein 1 n=1 Tax=Aceria tosichella TaxID=561515 RepID=A0A6G1SDS5_9ACAR
MSVHNFEVRFEERLRKKAFAHYDCHSMTVDFANPIKHRILQERRNTTTGASAASLVGSQQQQPPFINKHGIVPMLIDDPTHHNASNNAHSTNLHVNNNNTHIMNNNNNINNNNSNGDDKKLRANCPSQRQDYYTTTNDIYNNGNGTKTTNDPQHDSLSPHQDLGDGRQNDLVSTCPVFRNEIGGEEERIICLNKLTDRRQAYMTTELHKPSFVSGVSILESTSSPMKNICPYQRSLQCNPVIDYADTGATYYRNYFYGREHQNWFGNSETYGPLAISLRKEQCRSTSRGHNNNQQVNDVKYQYRIIIRTSELAVLRGTVYEDCIPNLTQRTSTKDVLEYLLAKSDIPLNKLRLGTPQAEARLLKLDEHKLTKNYKIGILYCKAGQSTEEEFYNNEHSGPLFDEFLSCIGENVRLLGFDKYKGGLDNKSDSTGLYSIYSTYEDCEIMFHVSTMLPYSANNRQQLSRKRHIGNDIVTIVFQEEGALPFTPKSFRSQFQHIFIIVRALNPPILPDGSHDFSAPRHYAVAVSRSKEMPPFGPPIPEGGIFVKSPQFKNFLLAKVINAENAAHKYCDKFREMGQWTRRGLLKDLLEDCVTNTTLSDRYGGSNSGTSGAVKIVSSLFGGKKRTQQRYAIFCGHSDIQGAIVWDIQVKDFGQSNKIIDCILGISATYLVVIEQQTKELLYVSPVEAILGWTSSNDWIKIFCHQAECLLVQIKDPDVDEIGEILTRLKAVTNGCETRELTLRRKNSQNSLGFDIQPDGIVTRVDAGSIAWQTHLQPGSRLVEICKTSTATLSYSQMMEYIRTSAVVTLTVLPPNSDGTYRRGCLGQTCAHQPIISRPPSTFSSASSNMHFSKPKRRVPTTSLMTLV